MSEDSAENDAPKPVEPCYHDGKFVAHEFGTGCPAFPPSLHPLMAEWLQRLDDGDPQAVEAFRRLFKSIGMEWPDGGEPEPLLSPKEQRDLNRQIEEGQRIRAQGAAAGGNYLIGGTSAPPGEQS